MAKPDGMILLAGGLAFVGNFKEQGGFPSNGYAIVGGTFVLAFIFALAKSTPLDPAVKALAALILLVSVYTYVPNFRKAKANG